MATSGEKNNFFERKIMKSTQKYSSSNLEGEQDIKFSSYILSRNSNESQYL